MSEAGQGKGRVVRKPIEMRQDGDNRSGINLFMVEVEKRKGESGG